jgi:hypothetical protein
MMMTTLPRISSVSIRTRGVVAMPHSSRQDTKIWRICLTSLPFLSSTASTAATRFNLVFSPRSQYSQEEQDYGLVQINSNGSVTLRTDYDNLQGQYNKLNTSLLESTNPSSTGIKAPACASNLITASQFSKNFTLPAVCPGCQDLIDNGISNPKNGKIVDVSATTPKQQIYGTNGAVISGLKLNKLSGDGANGPGQQSTTPSGTSGTGSAAQPSETKKGAATKLGGAAFALAGAFIAALLI